MLVDECSKPGTGWTSSCFIHAPSRASLLQLDEWDFQRTIESNLNGPFLLMQLAANWMHSEARSGVIINLISAGPTPPHAPEKAAFYASQMALRALTRAAAPELAARGVHLFGITCAASSLICRPGRRAGCQLARDRQPAGARLHRRGDA
jgi:NAD(P)-dependent dehydrogenase (short-subunit alcohol dehydrogenase family)